ncbi:uncharacterized protein LOC143057994 [Mytilus galloprovincialis]|uniref:uncharacterized protein LOC143057994 n=1 Tax=Mytilus galloprovincialis TaxID=29158 RepID=UPI003F7CCADB
MVTDEDLEGVGEATGVMAGETIGVMAGETIGVTAGETLGVTAGETLGETAGEILGVTAGEILGVTAGDTIGVLIGETEVDTGKQTYMVQRGQQYYYTTWHQAANKSACVHSVMESLFQEKLLKYIALRPMLVI